MDVDPNPAASTYPLRDSGPTQQTSPLGLNRLTYKIELWRMK